MRGPRHSHRRFRGARVRWLAGDRWEVRARVERFVEPALLLLLRERPMHGFELLEQLPRLAASDRPMDLGNLYRVLRALEEDGIVRSQWQRDEQGPGKRVYELTEEGERLLAGWAAALASARDALGAFLDRYERGEEVRT